LIGARKPLRIQIIRRNTDLNKKNGICENKNPSSSFFVVICGSVFQPRQNRGKMPLPQNKGTELLGKKKRPACRAAR
jgi:hypothetical protein